MAQADELADAASGINAGILDDVPQFSQAIEGKFFVPVLDSLDEVLNVINDFIADVIDFLGQLTVSQLGCDFVHRLPFPREPLVEV